MLSRKFSFRYLGVDVVMNRAAARLVFPKRADAFDACAFLVASLPRAQRGAVVADCMAGLYLAPGTVVPKEDLNRMSTSAFHALAGKRKAAKHFTRICHNNMHLFGPSVICTHPNGAVVASVVRQLARSLAMGWITTASGFSSGSLAPVLSPVHLHRYGMLLSIAA